jgi:hypothetical protein
MFIILCILIMLVSKRNAILTCLQNILIYDIVLKSRKKRNLKHAVCKVGMEDSEDYCVKSYLRKLSIAVLSVVIFVGFSNDVTRGC